MTRRKWRVAKVNGAWCALSPFRTTLIRFHNWENAIGFVFGALACGNVWE
jgi:hypothetical protein